MQKTRFETISFSYAKITADITNPTLTVALPIRIRLTGNMEAKLFHVNDRNLSLRLINLSYSVKKGFDLLNSTTIGFKSVLKLQFLHLFQNADVTNTRLLHTKPLNRIPQLLTYSGYKI
jgi:hypothetical protein